MRPIKFRAWHFNDKKMLEVDELNHIASWSFD
nr:MAG TPA: YopX protein [Bacteriophage sp.]DAX27302.1 MAG TPA: YopX protein [Caudoviricetes sp.]